MNRRKSGNSVSRTGHVSLENGYTRQTRNVNTVTAIGYVVDSYKQTRELFHCNFGYDEAYDGYYYLSSIGTL